MLKKINEVHIVSVAPEEDVSVDIDFDKNGEVVWISFKLDDQPYDFNTIAAFMMHLDALDTLRDYIRTRVSYGPTGVGERKVVV